MRRGILLCSALLLFAGSATAQEESKLHFLLNGGLSLPQKPDVFKDGWKEGFNVGGGVAYRLSRHFTFQALVNYDRFLFDEEGLLRIFTEETGFDPGDVGLSIDVRGAEISILSVSGELKASFAADPNKVSPYVIGGGGMAHVSAGDTTVSGSFMGIDLAHETIPGESENRPIATVGAGVDIPLGARVGILVEGRYQFNFTEDEGTDFASVRGGLRIGL